MSSLKGFSEFSNFKTNENSKRKKEERSQAELLAEIMEDFPQKKVEDFLEQRQLNLDEVSFDQAEGENFVLSISSLDFIGIIPSEISYYLDDLCQFIAKETGLNLSWTFSPNYNCTEIIFHLDDEIDPKIVDVKKSLRFHS